MSFYSSRLQQHIETHLGGAAPAELKAFLDAINADYLQHAHYNPAHARHAFLSSLSHEIRTPMNSILGMSELLLGHVDMPPSLQENLFILHGAAHHLLSLFNDILDFSRLEAGKLELDALDFNVARTLENALDAVMFGAQRKNIEFLLDIAPDVPASLNGDPARLRQIVQRLLEYTVKLVEYSDIWITVQLQDSPSSNQQITLDIKIHSQIPSSQQSAYIEMFQVQPGKMPLDLSVCLSILELLGGSLNVHQAQPYTVAHFSLPCRRGETLAPPPMPSDWQGRKVLVADPNAGYRAILTRLLTAWGLAVTECADGEINPQSSELFIVDAQLAKADKLPKAKTLIMHKTLWLSEALLEFTHLHKPLKRNALYHWLQNTLRSPDAVKPEQGLDILLVEDNPVNQKVAILMLRKLGHSVDVANDGLSALNTLTDKLFDVILMDVQMPNMDGLTATREIRIREAQGLYCGKRGRVPIIAMTAYALRGDREKCLAAGMDSYLSKPVSQEVLAGTLNEVLQADIRLVDLPIMDLGRLEESMNHDRARIHMLIKVFLEDLPAHMEAINMAVQASNATTIAREARALRNTLMSFDAQLAAQAAGELEELTDSGVLEETEKAFNCLQTEIERLRQALNHALLL